MKKLLFIGLMILVQLQSLLAVSYTTFRRDVEVLLSKDKADWAGDYNKRSDNFKVPVVINNQEKTITLGGETFEFYEIPKEWNVSMYYRSVRYECIDLKTLGKVYIYLIEYDKTKNCRLMLVWYDIDDKSVEIYNMKRN